MRFAKLINSYEFLKKIEERSKEAAPYQEDWEAEYGGDPQGIDQEIEEELDLEDQYYFDKENREKGKVILSLMGTDISQYSESDIDTILTERPDLLKLTPKFDVSGQWVHTVREVNMNNLEATINSIMSSNKELCVTSGDAAEFWNFSGFRVYALVLEGTCKVLWNADMYSSPQEDSGQLITTMLQDFKFINEMTEGWLVPSDCALVGVKVNWESFGEQHPDIEEATAALQEIVAKIGVPLVNKEILDKQLVDMEFFSEEEAAQYSTCEIDVESPEHMYEPTEEGGTYEEQYTQQLEEALKAQDFQKADELLAYGNIPINMSNLAVDNSRLLKERFINMPESTFSSLLSNLKDAGGYVDPYYFERIFEVLLMEGQLNKIRLLLESDIVDKYSYVSIFVDMIGNGYFNLSEDSVFPVMTYLSQNAGLSEYLTSSQGSTVYNAFFKGLKQRGFDSSLKFIQKQLKLQESLSKNI